MKNFIFFLSLNIIGNLLLILGCFIYELDINAISVYKDSMVCRIIRIVIFMFSFLMPHFKFLKNAKPIRRKAI
jgi:hypothetical protein